MDRLGINMQTVFGLPPAECVDLAGDLGCSHISTGLAPVPWKLDEFPSWSLVVDAALRRNTINAMRDRGVALSLVEGFTIRPGSEMAKAGRDLDVAAELGAERVSAVSMEPDAGRAFEQIALVAELAAERNMSLTFEFAPPHTFNNLAAALSVVRRIGRTNTSLLIDAMHFFRSGGTVAELTAVEPKLIGYIQLCDAALVGSGEEYYREASFERECPGDGELPLIAMLSVLPRNLPIGLEVPMRSAISAEGLRPVVERIVRASRGLLEAL
jgi:sugar phosphate isomerase/epimerase